MESSPFNMQSPSPMDDMPEETLSTTTTTTTTRKSRIAFGSCNNQELQNHLWPIIHARQPAAFVWAGDSIYADRQIPKSNLSLFPSVPNFDCGTPERMRLLYKKQRSAPGYQQLIQGNVTIFGTFDDHDYGCNNADRTFLYRNQSGKAFVDFIDLPEDSAMRRRAEAGYGVYGVTLLDFARAPGQEQVPEIEAGIDPDAVGSSSKESLLPMEPTYSNRSVAIFVLDVRSNKTPWKKGAAAYVADEEGDFLGEEQWSWFETAIRRSRATVNIIVNGLQIHANRFPDGNIAESWARYPHAQQRLYDAILQEGVSTPMLVSGDVHMAEFMRKDCVRRSQTTTAESNDGDDEDSPVWVRPLTEMTTSGMTHSWGGLSNPPLGHPLQRKVTLKRRYTSWLGQFTMHLGHFMCPWTDIMLADQNDDKNEVASSIHGGGEQAKTGLQYSLFKNFGEMEFDWDAQTITVRVMGEHKAPANGLHHHHHNNHTIFMADAPILLSATRPMDSMNRVWTVPSKHLTRADVKAAAAARRTTDESEWICVNYRAPENFVLQTVGHVTSIAILTPIVLMPVLIPALFLFLLVRGRPLKKVVASFQRLQQQR